MLGPTYMTFKYPSSISSFERQVSNCQAFHHSFTFLIMLSEESPVKFLTNCCVIVLPPNDDEPKCITYDAIAEAVLLISTP